MLETQGSDEVGSEGEGERCYLSIEFILLFHSTVEIDSDAVCFIVLTQSGERAMGNIVSHREIVNNTRNQINITDENIYSDNYFFIVKFLDETFRFRYLVTNGI